MSDKILCGRLCQSQTVHPRPSNRPLDRQPPKTSLRRSRRACKSPPSRSRRPGTLRRRTESFRSLDGQFPFREGSSVSSCAKVDFRLPIRQKCCITREGVTHNGRRAGLHSNLTPTFRAVRQTTRQRRLMASGRIMSVNSSGIPSGLSTSRQAPVSDRLRTRQSNVVLWPKTMLPALRVRRRGLLRGVFIGEWLSRLRLQTQFDQAADCFGQRRYGSLISPPVFNALGKARWHTDSYSRASPRRRPPALFCYLFILSHHDIMLA